MEAGGRNKRFPSFDPPAKGKEGNTKKSQFCQIET